MTAEIAIMNKLGVALAADSAVTVQTQTGQKIYNTVNKLFTLSKYQPIGIMIFGSAELMRVPWEALIKLYRSKLGLRKFPKVRDYAKDFVRFLERNRLVFTSPEQQKHFCRTVEQYFEDIVQEINRQVEEALAKKPKITLNEISNLVKRVIQRRHREWEGEKRLRLPANHEARIRRRYNRELAKIKKRVFKKLPLSRLVSAQLSEIAGWLFTKAKFRTDCSGIVFAGFGTNETFPNLYSVRVEGLLVGSLKYIEHNTASIDFDNEAAILPFAQSEMVVTFIEGVDPFYQRSLEVYLKKLFNEYPDAVDKALKLPKSTKKTALNKIRKESKTVLTDLLKSLRDYRTERHVSRILDAVRILPKDELAAMAESLVNLTSFKRRVTMDAETVGGPIDVAVISKGDGFVWIKRKHYFTKDLNPHFIANYYRDEKS
jgi:hypothetical protein